jgi:hypothetical protein
VRWFSLCNDPVADIAGTGGDGEWEERDLR